MAKEHTQEIRVRDQKVLVANIIKYTILIIGAFTMIFPFIWMLTTSLKTLDEAIAIPPTWLPSIPRSG